MIYAPNRPNVLGPPSLGVVVVRRAAASRSNQTFRQALIAKLGSIAALSSIVGEAIYPGALPETHDLGRDGPALCYSIPSYPRGHVLSGADGTATARVTFAVWAYQLSDADGATLALWDAIDGVPDGWGDGTCVITRVVHQDERDDHIAPRAGSDQWVYRIESDYSIQHRTGFPTMT